MLGYWPAGIVMMIILGWGFRGCWFFWRGFCSFRRLFLSLGLKARVAARMHRGGIYAPCTILSI